VEAPASPPPTATDPAGDPAASPLARVAGVFGFPTATFASIARRPGWVLPLALLTLLSLAATAALVPRLDFESAVRERLEGRQPPVPEERIDQVIEGQKRFAGTFAYAWAFVAPTVTALLLAAIFWVAFKAFGWDVKFRQAFGVTAHALLPTIGASMLLIYFATRLDIIDPRDLNALTHSNAALLVDREENPVLHSLLGSIDVFSIWVFALLVIGFSTAAGITRKKAAILIGTLWALYVLGKVGFAAITA
jgi:Yip1 domain